MTLETIQMAFRISFLLIILPNPFYEGVGGKTRENSWKFNFTWYLSQKLDNDEIEFHMLFVTELVIMMMDG